MFHYTVLLFTLLTQSNVDPSGHWEGVVQIPNAELTIEIDLAKTAKGDLSGTFSQPAQGIKGLPMPTVVVENRSIRFVVKGGADVSTFAGVISDDGKSMSGDVTQGGFTIPFTLKHVGDARIAAAPRNAAISKELEGTWNGILEAGGNRMRIILTMVNEPNGTATGTIASPDGSGVEIPIAITQKGSSLSVEAVSVGASYTGVLNAAGTELVGAWTQATTTLPLTFRRAAK